MKRSLCIKFSCLCILISSVYMCQTLEIMEKMDLRKMDEELDRQWARWESYKEKQWEIQPIKLTVEEECIATGEFSVAFRGVYNDCRDVAVKAFPWSDEEQRMNAETAFEREVSVWRKLDHPNIAKFIDVKRDALRCIISEFLPKGTLKSYLQKNRRKKIPLRTVVQLALHLAKGLSYLHSKNIVHGNVNSETLLLDANLTLKLIDFSVAGFEPSYSRKMTANVGTPSYIAPEMIECKPCDRKCDVYSFGICLWEIYCCKAPHRKLSIPELKSRVVSENLRPNIPKTCPKSLADLMVNCWDPNPSKRPEMVEVVSKLEAMVMAESLDSIVGFTCLQFSSH